MIGATPALQQYMTQAAPGDALFDVLEMTHAAWAQGYIITTYHLPWHVTFEDGRSVDALPLAFRVDLPDAGTQGRQDMSITLDNVGAEIWRALELAQQQPQFPIQITWRAFLRSDPGMPAANPLRLQVVNVTVTEAVVQMTAERTDTINKRWPRVVYQPERWPGLVR